MSGSIRDPACLLAVRRMMGEKSRESEALTRRCEFGTNKPFSSEANASDGRAVGRRGVGLEASSLSAEHLECRQRNIWCLAPSKICSLRKRPPRFRLAASPSSESVVVDSASRPGCVKVLEGHSSYVSSLLDEQRRAKNSLTRWVKKLILWEEGGAGKVLARTMKTPKITSVIRLVAAQAGRFSERQNRGDRRPDATARPGCLASAVSRPHSRTPAPWEVPMQLHVAGSVVVTRGENNQWNDSDRQS